MFVMCYLMVVFVPFSLALLTTLIQAFILNSYANQILDTWQKTVLFKPMFESCLMSLQCFYLSCF